MKNYFYINQESYEQFKVFENHIFRLEEITGMCISEFEIIYFHSYADESDRANLEDIIAVEMRILVPNKKLVAGDTQYRNIKFRTYQDRYEHYDLQISYEYLSREIIEDMKKLY